MNILRLLAALFGAAVCLLAFGQTAWSQARYAHTGAAIITNVSVREADLR